MPFQVFFLAFTSHHLLLLLLPIHQLLLPSVHNIRKSAILGKSSVDLCISFGCGMHEYVRERHRNMLASGMCCTRFCDWKRIRTFQHTSPYKYRPFSLSLSFFHLFRWNAIDFFHASESTLKMSEIGFSTKRSELCEAHLHCRLFGCTYTTTVSTNSIYGICCKKI